MHKDDSLTICWPQLPAPGIEEEAYCYRFCREYSQKKCLQSEPALVWMDYSPAQELDWLLQNCSAQKILLITNPKILMNALAPQRLSRLLDRGYAACGPVFNLTGLQKQQADLPAVYLNLSTYEEILQLMAHEPGLDSVRVDRLDPACVLFARSYLQGLDQKIRLKEMALQAADSSAGSMAVELKSLVHNFGDYFSAQRDDLIRLAPLECRRVLDVGCAAGEYGKGLKEKIPEAEVIGIELDADMAGLAAAHYRHVLVQQVQEVEFAEPFDLINCGDVLEHLQDPWTVLDKLHSLLARQGILVISLPNAGHWTIVRDLLQGRFEYVPWGLLCITHVRWFTEESIRKALEDAGFEIEVFDRQQIEPTPQGKEFIQKMIEQGYGDETSLLSNEFLIRARRK